jgi:hypothetical protein
MTIKQVIWEFVILFVISPTWLLGIRSGAQESNDQRMRSFQRGR